MSVCQVCNKPLPVEYSEQGLDICANCLDNMDDGYEDYDDGSRDLNYFSGMRDAEDDY